MRIFFSGDVRGDRRFKQRLPKLLEHGGTKKRVVQRRCAQQ